MCVCNIYNIIYLFVHFLTHKSTKGGDMEITTVGFYIVFKVLHWFDMDSKDSEWLWALGGKCSVVSTMTHMAR